MKIDFGGGINELNDINIPVTDAIDGQNFELGLGNTKLRPRAPFDLVGTAPNASQIHGIHQLIKRDGTKTSLVAAGTDIYTVDGATWTDVGNVDASAEFYDFAWELDQYIILTDRAKEDVLKKWDGTTFSDLTTGLGTPLYAKYGLVANGRAILANITDDTTEVPHMLLLSAFENPESYDTSSRAGSGGFATGNEAAYLLTPDLRPINGLIEFQQDIVISTEGGKLFRLVGNDATNYQFVDYYAGSSALGDNSFVNAGNDVYYLRQGGVIESLVSTDRYGDVGTDDISLPLRTTVNEQTSARVVYDQRRRKIYWFVQSKVLVLFKDLLGTDQSPWAIYRTNHPSNFNTISVRYMDAPETNDDSESVYFGDEDGNLFQMSGTGVGDAGSYDITTIRKLPLQGFNYDAVLSGRVYYRRLTECSLNIVLEWGDEQSETDISIPLRGVDAGDLGAFYAASSFYAGDSYYAQGISGGGAPSSKGFSAAGQGSSVFATLEVTSSGPFEIDYIEA